MSILCYILFTTVYSVIFYSPLFTLLHFIHHSHKQEPLCVVMVSFPNDHTVNYVHTPHSMVNIIVGLSLHLYVSYMIIPLVYLENEENEKIHSQ